MNQCFEVRNLKEKAAKQKDFNSAINSQQILQQKHLMPNQLLTFVIDFALTSDSPISRIGFLERTTGELQDQRV